MSTFDKPDALPETVIPRPNMRAVAGLQIPAKTAIVPARGVSVADLFSAANPRYFHEIVSSHALEPVDSEELNCGVSFLIMACSRIERPTAGKLPTIPTDNAAKKHAEAVAALLYMGEVTTGNAAASVGSEHSSLYEESLLKLDETVDQDQMSAWNDWANTAMVFTNTTTLSLKRFTQNAMNADFIQDFMKRIADDPAATGIVGAFFAIAGSVGSKYSKKEMTTQLKAMGLATDAIKRFHDSSDITCAPIVHIPKLISFSFTLKIVKGLPALAIAFKRMKSRGTMLFNALTAMCVTQGATGCLAKMASETALSQFGSKTTLTVIKEVMDSRGTLEGQFDEQHTTMLELANMHRHPAIVFHLASREVSEDGTYKHANLTSMKSELPTAYRNILLAAILEQEEAVNSGRPADTYGQYNSETGKVDVNEAASRLWDETREKRLQAQIDKSTATFRSADAPSAGRTAGYKRPRE